MLCMTSAAATTSAPITIRRATDADARAIDRLARLDSQRTPEGPHLVALSGERFVAAVALRSGRVVADPFTASEQIVELLRERAGHLTGPDAPPRRAAHDPVALLRGLFPAGRAAGRHA
jgi:hypothetical protein